MPRRTILLLAVILAVVAGVAPPIAAYWLSRDKAVEAEQQHLDEYARWTLARASIALEEGRRALDAAAAHPNVAPCSPDHIAWMRRITVDSKSVDEVGYFENGALRCSSWGPLDRPLAEKPSDRTLPDGMGISFDVRPVFGGSARMIALRKGDYNVLIDRRRLVDVLTDTRMTLGLATSDGDLIAASHAIEPDLLGAVISGRDVGGTEAELYASARIPGFTAFALSDRHALQDQLARERMLLIPLGLLASALMVGLVIWMSRQRLSPRGELEIAIRKKEFVAHYQPIIELATGRCVGAEALVRWRRPDGSWIPPDLFIPLAEASGLIEPLTDLVIQRVAEDLTGLLVSDRSIHVAINIAPKDIETGRFLPVLDRMLETADIAPDQIWLECTERGFMAPEAARATLERARAAGHRVAIDDFGTGYSSLAMLQQLPLDTLKIDKAFIDAIGRDAAASVVTPHIIEMARGLGLHVVAEGVETREQEAYVREAGVGFTQGWLYSKPLPAEAFIAFLNRRNAGPVLRAVESAAA
ncbi:EAL domain-containing protein [Brevundimonas sp. GCM10030266]|uniref:EAL domain-containing protein n=1 Tax=Brevundimonas sp. GCM10030266 TaxID=3273386 RepID=UPI003615C9A0